MHTKQTSCILASVQLAAQILPWPCMDFTEPELRLNKTVMHWLDWMQTREIMAKSTPMAVPAALFVMQQVLVIVAASHLDAVTFQICSQSFKIMPTALFAVWLLGQLLTPMQWASLPVLAVCTCFLMFPSCAFEYRAEHPSARPIPICP